MGSANVIVTPDGTSDRCLHLEDDDIEEVHLSLGALLAEFLALYSSFSSDEGSNQRKYAYQ